MEKFPFIVGCPRSGTSLLSSMLDSHSEFAVPPESFFITKLRRFAQDPELRTDLLTEELLEDERLRTWKLSHDAIRQAVQGTDVSSYQDAVRNLYGTFAEVCGKRYYADKTPQYATQIRLLSELFPEAVFIHLIRDGRNVSLALTSAPFGPDTHVDAAFRWQHIVGSARSAGRALGPGSYLELRYESLVRSPRAALTRLCAFVGVEFEEGMLDFRSSAKRWVSRAFSPSAHDSLTKPLKAGIRDWKTQMDAKDVAVFEAMAGRTLSECGYDRGCSSPPIAARIQAAAVKTSSRLRRSMRGVSQKLGSFVPTGRP